MKDKIIIVKPKCYAGRLAIKNGEPFRYPSQSFFVQPVRLLDTLTDTLVGDYIELGKHMNDIPMTPNDIELLLKQLQEMGVTPESVMENMKAKSVQEAADYINGFLHDKTALTLDPTIVYDYQSLLATGVCPSCGIKLDWRIATHVTGNDDKFCFADCCGMRYSMVPEKVRVLGVPKKLEVQKEGDDMLADDEFIRELNNL